MLSQHTRPIPVRSPLVTHSLMLNGECSTKNCFSGSGKMNFWLNNQRDKRRTSRRKNNEESSTVIIRRQWLGSRRQPALRNQKKRRNVCASHRRLGEPPKPQILAITSLACLYLRTKRYGSVIGAYTYMRIMHGTKLLLNNYVSASFSPLSLAVYFARNV